MTKQECLINREWFDSVEAEPAYCSDKVSKTEDECLKKREWIPEVPMVKAYCSDDISNDII